MSGLPVHLREIYDRLEDRKPLTFEERLGMGLSINEAANQLEAAPNQGYLSEEERERLIEASAQVHEAERIAAEWAAEALRPLAVALTNPLLPDLAYARSLVLDALAVARLASTEEKVEGCERCGGEGDGPMPTTAGAEHGERIEPCPGCQPNGLSGEGREALSGEDRARLELIRDHDGNDLSENDKALLTRLAASNCHTGSRSGS